MGYSCSTLANFAYDAILGLMQDPDEKLSNCWNSKGKRYMVEIGRENPDGAMTGSVYLFCGPEQNKFRRVGTIRIERDGTITRWPSSAKHQRIEAAEAARKRFQERMYA
jgi:hypothetical protein